LAIAGCKIDVKGGRLTFDVGEYHVEFGLFNEQGSSPSSSTCCGCKCGFSDVFVESFDVFPNDLHLLDYVSTEGLGLNYAMVDSAANLVPSRAKDKPYAFNKGYLSYYYRFARVLLPLSPLGEVEYEFNLGGEFGCVPSDGIRYKIILYVDHAVWRHLMLKKYLHPVYLRWLFLL